MPTLRSERRQRSASSKSAASVEPGCWRSACWAASRASSMRPSVASAWASSMRAPRWLGASRLASNSNFGCSGQGVAEPPSVCARRREAVPRALGRLGMRAEGSGRHRSGQAAVVGWARHTPARLPREPSGGRVAGSLRHDGAGAAARGLAVGGSSSSRVSNRAVQQRKQNHCVCCFSVCFSGFYQIIP